MPQGLQVFDENGAITIEISDSITKLLGSGSTGTTPSSIVDDNLLEGTPWVHVTRAYTLSTGTTSYDYYPHVTFSGNTMSWSWDSNCPVGKRLPYTFIYGVY